MGISLRLFPVDPRTSYAYGLTCSRWRWISPQLYFWESVSEMVSDHLSVTRRVVYAYALAYRDRAWGRPMYCRQVVVVMPQLHGQECFAGTRIMMAQKPCHGNYKHIFLISCYFGFFVANCSYLTGELAAFYVSWLLLTIFTGTSRLGFLSAAPSDLRSTNCMLGPH
jgi:hypothetical protein